MTGGQQPASSEIRVRCHPWPDDAARFPPLHAETRGGDTLLRGTVADQAAPHGVLAEVEALGLELLEFRRLLSG